MTIMRRRVVITGAAGVLGTALRRGLRQEYELSGIDLRAAEDDPDVRQGDVRELDPLKRQFNGVDAIVDLAAFPSPELSWSEVHANNIPASRAVLEAAYRSGVPRVIYASSNRLMGGYEREEPYASILRGNYCGLIPAEVPLITATMPVRPDTSYALGKAFGEAACRLYSDVNGLSTICLRIGTVRPDERPHNQRDFARLRG